MEKKNNWDEVRIFFCLWILIYLNQKELFYDYCGDKGLVRFLIIFNRYRIFVQTRMTFGSTTYTNSNIITRINTFLHQFFFLNFKIWCKANWSKKAKILVPQNFCKKIFRSIFVLWIFQNLSQTFLNNNKNCQYTDQNIPCRRSLSLYAETPFQVPVQVSGYLTFTHLFEA